MIVHAYCDGAVKNNGKPGRIGMGCYLLYFDSVESKAAGETIFIRNRCWGMEQKYATNNLAELYAIQTAIQNIESDPANTSLYIFTDSDWAKKAILGEYNITCHVELVANIRELLSEFGEYDIQWVRGHDGNKWNEEANRLAQQMAGTWKGKKRNSNER